MAGTQCTHCCKRRDQHAVPHSDPSQKMCRGLSQCSTLQRLSQAVRWGPGTSTCHAFPRTPTGCLLSGMDCRGTRGRIACCRHPFPLVPMAPNSNGSLQSLFWRRGLSQAANMWVPMLRLCPTDHPEGLVYIHQPLGWSGLAPTATLSPESLSWQHGRIQATRPSPAPP